jgi:hypothetical protein
MPNLEKYVTSLTIGPEESMYDGIAELYFESLVDADGAGESTSKRKPSRIPRHFLSRCQPTGYSSNRLSS